MKASLIIGSALVAVFFVGARPVNGQFVWQPTNGGFFNTSGNWLPFGPPGVGQVAQFNSATTQTVILQTNTTLANHRIDNGDITYQLNQTTNAITGSSGLIVGNTAGQTGRFTIVNGTMTGDMVIGNVAASTGLFTIGQDAIFDTGAIAGTEVGNSGVGSLVISSGGRFTGTSHLIVGTLAGSNGSVAVEGGGSNLTSGVLDIGGASVGEMTISNEGLVSAQAVNIGNSATGSGELLVTGQGSTLNTNNQIFSIGNLGHGEMAVASAGAVTSGVSRIGSSGGSTGSAVVSGVGSTWNATSLAVGGSLGSNGGAGVLQITDGGVVNVTGNVEIRSTANTAVTIDGGTLTVGGNFSRFGTLNLLDGTLHVTGQFDNGLSNLPITIDGVTAGAVPTLQLSGASGTLAHATTVTVGGVNRGSLIVDAGRLVNLTTNSLLIGTTATGNGSVTVAGAGSAINTTQTISVGGSAVASQGIGALTVSQNGSISASVLNVFPQGTLTIDNGTVNATTLAISNGATINFIRGRINLTAINANLTAGLLDALLGSTHELGANRTIGGGASTFALQAPLTINGGTLTSGSGGPLQNSSTLILNSGTVNSDATLTNDAGRIIQVSGTGIVTAGSILNNGTLLLNDNLVPIGGGTFTNIGVIRGTGVIANAMSNPAAGQIQVTTGRRLEFTSGTFNSSGIISVNGGELALAVGMNNNTNGLISGQNGMIRGGTTGIFNTGAMAFSAGAMDVYGDVTQQTGGKITITGGGTTTFYDDVTINPGANNIQVSAVGGVVSSVVFLGSYNGGTTGGGAAFIEGDHRPGNSPALVSFGGDVFYGSGSKLDIELGGTARGSQYDAVDSAAAVVLSGTLNVSLINGFTPSIGNTFTLLTAAGGISGKFANVTLPSTPAGGQWSLSYTANSAVLAASLLGDYNHNGTVDAPDYVIWRKTFGQSGFALAADGNGNGVIDPGDMNVWRSQFGKPPGSGSGASAIESAAVPEPTSLVLAIAALTSYFSLRQGRRRLS